MAEIAAKIEVTRRSLVTFKNVDAMYLFARDHVFARRSHELERDWADILDASLRRVSENKFLMEYMWCVYVAGFSAQRISGKRMLLLVAHNILDPDFCYLPITRANLLVSFDESMRPLRRMNRVLRIFKNKAKACAVQRTRAMILREGWDKYSERCGIQARDPEKIEASITFMGPALSRHLARNLGNVSVVKPDVHLNRLAQHYKFESAEKMCQHISKNTNMELGRVDLILWYACMDHGTLSGEKK